jgi:hypothetical protein
MSTRARIHAVEKIVYQDKIREVEVERIVVKKEVVEVEKIVTVEKTREIPVEKVRGVLPPLNGTLFSSMLCVPFYAP